MTQGNSETTRILGWSALSGIAVVLIAFTLNYPLAQYDISVSSVLRAALGCADFCRSDHKVLLES